MEWPTHLLHRHFDLREDEILVLQRLGTCKIQPPSLVGFKEYTRNGLIRAQSWEVSNGRLVPYEFYLDRSPTSPTPKLATADFINELHKILEASNLSDVLGLCLLREIDRRQIEVTEGDANITFRLDQEELPDITNGGGFLRPVVGSSQLGTGTFCATITPTSIKTHGSVHNGPQK